MIQTLRQLSQDAESFCITQADTISGLLGGGAKGILLGAGLVYATSMAIMLYGALARLRV